MKPISVADFLKPVGFAEPDLSALAPDTNTYRTLLLHPSGPFAWSNKGVWNFDSNQAALQYAAFIDLAAKENADVVVTPEYSFPWAALEKAIEAGSAPKVGQVWILGCESITVAELNALKKKLSGKISIEFEKIVAEGEKFLDPLLYIFQTKRLKDETPALVGLVQFKTQPMGDADNFEIANMTAGKNVYFFQKEHSVKLISFICSDALAVTDAIALDHYSNSLIFHLQLNKEPRHQIFRTYRDQFLKFENDTTEIVCLNWSNNMCACHDGKKSDWKNISGSAWYSKSRAFDQRDEAIKHNHSHGLYYTWLKGVNCHATFLNYGSAVFLIEATKAYHHGQPGAVSRRLGPKGLKTYAWASKAWEQTTTIDDGWTLCSEDMGDARSDLDAVRNENPLYAERLITLTSGGLTDSEDWHSIKELSSCRLEATEIVRRYTFCQDTDQSAADFRSRGYASCKHIKRILTDEALLPPALKDLKEGFALRWRPDAPHQNISSKKGERATAIYMGDANSTKLENITKHLDLLLHRSSTPEKSAWTRERLAVFHSKDGKVTQFGRHRNTAFDKTDADIGSTFTNTEGLKGADKSAATNFTREAGE